MVNTEALHRQRAIKDNVSSRVQRTSQFPPTDDRSVRIRPTPEHCRPVGRPDRANGGLSQTIKQNTPKQIFFITNGLSFGCLVNSKTAPDVIYFAGRGGIFQNFSQWVFRLYPPCTPLLTPILLHSKTSLT